MLLSLLLPDSARYTGACSVRWDAVGAISELVAALVAMAALGFAVSQVTQWRKQLAASRQIELVTSLAVAAKRFATQYRSSVNPISLGSHDGSAAAKDRDGTENPGDEEAGYRGALYEQLRQTAAELETGAFMAELWNLTELADDARKLINSYSDLRQAAMLVFAYRPKLMGAPLRGDKYDQAFYVVYDSNGARASQVESDAERLAGACQKIALSAGSVRPGKGK